MGLYFCMDNFQINVVCTWYFSVFWLWHVVIDMGHSLSHGNYLFGQQYGNTGNRVYTSESMWHEILNVTTGCGICIGVHIHSATTLVRLLSHCDMEVYTLEQHSCMKVAVLYSRNAWECHAQQCESMSDHFQGHQTVARKVQAFIGGKVWTANMHHSGCPVCVHTNMSVTTTEQCRKKDRLWTVQELAKYTGISPAIVHWILRPDLNSARLLQSGYYLI